MVAPTRPRAWSKAGKSLQTWEDFKEKRLSGQMKT